MKIHYAGPEDLSGWMALVKLQADHFPGLDIHQYEADLKTAMARKEALAAKIGNQVVGGLAFSRDTGELAFLAVHPQFQRQGIAKALVETLITEFPKGTPLFVITYREGDPLGTAARSLYQRMGFLPGPLLTVFNYPCQRMDYPNL